jgi:DNA-binding transcriptional MerR regulator
VLTVSKLAKAAGVRPDTVRYYERQGLIPPADRTASGYRMYGQDMVGRLRFIRGSQRFGLRLREIKGLLEIIDRGLCPCGHARELLEARIVDVDRQIAELTELRGELDRVREGVGPETCEPGVWPCEQEFIQAGGGDQDGTV